MKTYSFVHYKADTKLSFETAKLKDTQSFHYTISNIEAIFFFSEQSSCINTHASCNDYADYCEDADVGSAMRNNCPVTCGICGIFYENWYPNHVAKVHYITSFLIRYHYHCHYH